MRKIISIKFHLIILSIIMLSSCNTIKEDLSNCTDTGRFIKFNFDYHMGDNNFDNDIDIIGMYLFDSDGLFLDVMSTKRADLLEGNLWSIDVDCKGHTAVIWAGLESSDYTDFTLPEMSIGDNISTLLFELNASEGDSINEHINPMFWGGQEVLTFTELENTTQTMTLLRNNNLVNLTVKDQHGVYLDLVTDYSAVIMATNAKYKSNNMITDDSFRVTYLPVTRAVGDTPSSNIYSFSTLRFVESYSDDVMLKILDNSTDAYIMFPDDTDALKVIEHLTSESIALNLGKQEHLDRENIWDINLVVNIPEDPKDAIVVISVTVNDWTTYILNEDL